MLCDDGVLEELLFRRAFLALLGDGRLVLLFLELTTHAGRFEQNTELARVKGKAGGCSVASRDKPKISKSRRASVIDKQQL